MSKVAQYIMSATSNTSFSECASRDHLDYTEFSDRLEYTVSEACFLFLKAQAATSPRKPTTLRAVLRAHESIQE